MSPRKKKSAEEVAKRQAAWAKVGRDVFPLWSNPSRFTQPLRRWDDWSGEDAEPDPGRSPADGFIGQSPPAATGPSPRRSWPVPGPDSPFYVPSPSDKALRRYLVVLCIAPLLLLGVGIAAAVTRQWADASLGLALVFGVLRWVQIRAVLRELSRRQAVR